MIERITARSRTPWEVWMTYEPEEPAEKFRGGPSVRIIVLADSAWMALRIAISSDWCMGKVVDHYRVEPFDCPVIEREGRDL